ncbi:MAG: hypothetical protein NVSMB64_25160 [Candidatus Velthaea sp.]
MFDGFHTGQTGKLEASSYAAFAALRKFLNEHLVEHIDGRQFAVLCSIKQAVKAVNSSQHIELGERVARSFVCKLTHVAASSYSLKERVSTAIASDDSMFVFSRVSAAIRPFP